MSVLALARSEEWETDENRPEKVFFTFTPLYRRVDPENNINSRNKG
jgi:hypothetical protein